ncbi:MAG: DUF5996 family protein [Caulobacteraceae bacterium]
MGADTDPNAAWPALSYARLRPTVETLHLWSQIVGKVAVARSPWLNHSWHLTLRLSARGLATPLIPAGAVSLQLEFDFVAHDLVLRCTDGGERRVPLRPGTVAGVYAQVMDALAALGAPTRIVASPNELPDPTPFPKDHERRAYEPDVARDFWRALVQIERVFGRFRTRFVGKTSPIHFFWGSADLAVTRFSGRRAPPHPGGIPNLPDAVTREAYSHEVSSAGFWAGDPGTPEPSFYAYAYPSPAGFADAPVSPPAARFDARLGEFILPYEAVRGAADPDEALLAFLQTTYEAAADLAGWDRSALDREEGQIGRPPEILGGAIA